MEVGYFYFFNKMYLLTKNCIHELFLAGVSHLVETFLAASLLSKPEKQNTSTFLRKIETKKVFLFP